MLDKLTQDKNRQEEITRITTRLAEIWKNYPQFRLNQLIYCINSVRVMGADMFDITDAEFENYMEESTKVGGEAREKGKGAKS
jgi:hypothetical protein